MQTFCHRAQRCESTYDPIRQKSNMFPEFFFVLLGVCEQSAGQLIDKTVWSFSLLTNEPLLSLDANTPIRHYLPIHINPPLLLHICKFFFLLFIFYFLAWLETSCIIIMLLCAIRSNIVFTSSSPELGGFTVISLVRKCHRQSSN